MSAKKPEEPALDLFGDLVPMKPMPFTTARVINTAVAVRDEPPDRTDFLHAILCQVGMPRKATEGRLFERTGGTP
jgi:hypothetical protein